MLLAELVVRHTRRHMPTRRVAPGSAYLPMAGAASPGALLTRAIVYEFAPLLDDDERDAFEQFIATAVGGVVFPRIAVRHRLQRDTHGLDRSRHRILQEPQGLTIELDTHGAALPQLLGLVIALAMLPSSARQTGVDAARRALRGTTHAISPGITIRRLSDGTPFDAPWAPGAVWQPGAPIEELRWEGVDSEQRWAMEVLGLRAGVALVRDDVNRRFRRLLRDAHPDTGALTGGAAERIEELTAARDLLLDLVVRDADASLAPNGAP